jgi:hypothetical protein
MHWLSCGVDPSALTISGPSLYSWSMHAWVRNKDRMGFPWERRAGWLRVFKSPPATALIKQFADNASDILCQQFKEPLILFSVRKSALADKSWTPNQIESVHLWTSEHDIAFRSTGPRIITYTSCFTLSSPLVPCWPTSRFIEEDRSTAKPRAATPLLFSRRRGPHNWPVSSNALQQNSRSIHLLLLSTLMALLRILRFLSSSSSQLCHSIWTSRSKTLSSVPLPNRCLTDYSTLALPRST